MRYFLFVSYNGTAFNGSQIQGDLPTVQLSVNNALSTLLRKPIESYGASRTDEGVHALMNVYHFDHNELLDDKFVYRLNAILPYTMCITDMKVCINPESNCRFDAISRQYRYKIHLQKNPFLHERSFYLPFKLNNFDLNESAALLKNYTDFTTFSKKKTQSYTNICKIFDSYWIINEDSMEYIVEANRFLRGMVRALVGTQLQIIRGKYDIHEFQRRIEAKDCQLADFSVPGHGLYLENITYPNNYFITK